MVHPFLPTLSPFDVERATQLIQHAYAPPAPGTTPDDLRHLQQELFEIQKRPEAWGLIVPLLEHPEMNVQFYGAHTAQVKIARDWDSFPADNAELLRDLLVQLTSHAIAVARGRFILRKLFVALTSLALKLAPGHPSRWPDWILFCVSSFSGHGAQSGSIHDFLAIVAEEISTADLLGPSKLQIIQDMTDASPMVVQSIISTINNPASAIPPPHLDSALTCLQSWMSFLTADDVTSLVPLLIALLNLSESHSAAFIASSDALQEMLTKSAISDGAGSKSLTEPLLIWLDTVGHSIVEATATSGDTGDTSHSLCKLLVALGEHSCAYFAANIASQVAITSASATGTQSSSRGHLVQTFLRLLMAYTGLPGYYGVDEEESELTMGFWYLFQEALWSTNYNFPEEDDVDELQLTPQLRKDMEPLVMAKAVYIELVQILRRKVMLPPPGTHWLKDQTDKFMAYRRDVGDTLINAFYILRDDMLGYYVNDIAERLQENQGQGWQEIEATLHCIMSIQEALDYEKAPQLGRLFSPEILGRLPTTGHHRIRRTTLNVIGTYSSWFAAQPVTTAPATSEILLLSVLSYVVTALTDPSLCLQAALALRNLCDANRKALAPHIAAFGELHAGLERIPDSEKSKVLQSIASVIQALPPDDEIFPIETIMNPIVIKLERVLQSASKLPDEAMAVTILQLEIMAGVAKGLTRTTESIFVGDYENPTEMAENKRMQRAREDSRMVKLREGIFHAAQMIIDLWSTDAAIGQVLSELFKSITCLPSDATLLTLPAGPLLELTCMAAQRQLTSTWLSLSAILIAQMNPPLILLSLKPGPPPEAEAMVASVLPVILQCGLGVLGMPGSMDANPDIVQEFFACMDRVAQNFIASFFTLPPGALETLMQCAISCLALQERYSLVAACNFLSTLIHRSALEDTLGPARRALLVTHGREIMRAVLQGFAAIAPRSVVPNLIEMLGTLMSRGTGAGDMNSAMWMREILFADDFVTSKASTEMKESFIKAVAGSRSLKKTRDAAQQFTLVARGLEGTSFGYATVTM